MENEFIIKGNFYYCDEKRELVEKTGSYCIVRDGISEGLFDRIPKEYAGLPVRDYSAFLIIPGLIDLHTHAPQYTFRGLGMDMELLDWLNTYTFPEECKYSSLKYADSAYDIFVRALKNSYTTRAVIFGTIHAPATLLLMEKLERTGLITQVGKVNMDRNAPAYYVETTEKSICETEAFLKSAQKHLRTKPILTPRFIPSCSDKLLAGLGEIQQRTRLCVQSHLSENRSEIEWVRELCPDAAFYGDAYDRYGLFGNNCRTIMAHCVSSGDEETERMAHNGVFVAHCPASNMNLSSGVAPVRRYLERGIRVGLGTDVAAGSGLSVASEMVSAVQASKMRWRYVSQDKPLSLEDVFYMATRGGGEFFGQVGSFEKGFEFDALVIDDSGAESALKFNDRDRFLRSVYLEKECRLKAKYVRGSEIRLGA